MASGQPDRVITLIPSSRRSSPATSSSTYAATKNCLYGDEFIDNMRRKHNLYAQYNDEVLAPSSQPPSPSSACRVEHMIGVLRAALNRSPQSVPGMVDLGCVRHPPASRRVKAEYVNHAPILRLAEDEEQWRRWTAGDEKPPSDLTPTETSIIFRQKAGAIAVKLSRSASDAQLPRTKKRKLGSSDEVRSASQLNFPAVKRLKTPHNKGSEEKNALVAPNNGTAAVTPMSSPPRDPGNVVQVAPTSQDLPLRVDPHPAPTGSVLHTSFDLDSSIVSSPAWSRDCIDGFGDGNFVSQLFEPPMTSTPTKAANLEPKHSAEIGDQPFTPLRSKAADYVANIATPISENDAPPLDRRALTRVPTLEQLIRAESATKKRERREANKRQKFETLASSQNYHAQLEPLDEAVMPKQQPVGGLLTRQEPETPELDGAPDDTGATPTRTPSNSQGEITPTAPTAKRSTFESVISFAFGSLGFSSQYDVESKVDDISRFMKDDVDDVFL